MSVSDLGRAISTALAFPRGPVYLDIPTDLLDQPARPGDASSRSRRAAPGGGRYRQRRRGDRRGPRHRAVGRRGRGAVRRRRRGPGAGRGAQRAAWSPPSARGASCRAGHPCLVGMPPHEPEVAELIGAADLMIALGTDFDGMMTRNWTMPVPRRLANVNCDPVDLTKNYQPDIAVLADVRLSCRRAPRSSAGAAGRRPARSDAPSTAGSGRGCGPGWPARPSRPTRYACSIRSNRPPSPTPSSSPTWRSRGIGWPATPRSRAPQAAVPDGMGHARLRVAGGASEPATLGAPVLAVCGDGGFMFAVAELAAIVEASAAGGRIAGRRRRLRHVALRPACGPATRATGSTSPGPTSSRWRPRSESPAESVTDPGRPLAAALAAALGSGAPRLVVLETALTPPRTTSPRWRD